LVTSEVEMVAQIISKTKDQSLLKKKKIYYY